MWGRSRWTHESTSLKSLEDWLLGSTCPWCRKGSVCSGTGPVPASPECSQKLVARTLMGPWKMVLLLLSLQRDLLAIPVPRLRVLLSTMT